MVIIKASIWEDTSNDYEKIDDEGNLKTWASWPKYYGKEIRLWVYGLGFYYDRRDDFASDIIESKTNDISKRFWPRIEKLVDKEPDLRKADLITVIPRSNFSISATMQKIAAQLSKKLSIPYEQIIKKIKTVEVPTRSVEDRVKAISGTFELTRKLKDTEKRIIILDDMRSSGISMLEITKILKNCCKTVDTVGLCLGIHGTRNKR